VVASVASVVALVACLSACASPSEPPGGPTTQQIQAAVDERLDRQWEISGLQGEWPRPLVAVQKVQNSGQWNPELGVCLREGGIRDWGYATREGLRMHNAVATPEQQMLMYICFARYPTIDLLSHEQLDYIYDYFVRWLVPCLELHGYRLSDAPSRTQFVARSLVGNGVWNPYHAISRFPSSPEEQSSLLEDCSPTISGVPGWSS
jgi:hypothetical protein